MTILVCSFINEIIFFSKIHGSNIQGRQKERSVYFIFLAILASPNVSTSDSACKRKKSHITIYEVCQALKKIVLVSWESTFIFNFSDWWNQAACGFILVDLVSHVGTHGLDLNVSGIGIIRFICKPFLFC